MFYTVNTANKNLRQTFIASAYKMYSFSGFVNCASVASICMNQHKHSMTPLYSRRDQNDSMLHKNVGKKVISYPDLDHTTEVVHI